MHRSWFIPLVIWCSFGSSSAQAQDDEHAASTNPKTAGFAALVRQGARAADQGRLNAAIEAYEKALKIYHDPLIAGRFGLVLSLTGDLPTAAQYLYGAVMSNAGKSAKERKAFFEAWDFAQTKICRLIVSTNSTTAIIGFGNNISAHKGSVWAYATPGKHTIFGKLDGHGNLERTIDCPQGRETIVNFIFAPMIDMRKLREQAEEKLAFLDAENLTLRAPNRPDKSSSTPLGKTLRGVDLRVGPAVVFGITRVPAFGLSLASNFNVGKVPASIATRGAYAIGPYARWPIDVFSWTGLAGPCIRRDSLQGCAFASINVIQLRAGAAAPTDAYADAQVVPGFGVGLGWRHHFSKDVAVYANADAMILPQPVGIIIEKANGSSQLGDASHAIASLSAGLEFDR